MSTSLNKPSVDLIIDLINVANSTSLNNTKISFEAPSVLTDDPNNHNTGVKVVAIQGSGYIGDVDVTYNRLDIGLLFKNIALNLDVTSPTTTADLLPKLNSKYGLGLTIDDIEDNAVDMSGSGPHSHVIVMKTTSLAYIGQVTTTIGPDPEVGERLDTVILQTNLNGLLYPNSDTTKAQAREYSWGIDASSISAYLQVRVKDEVIGDDSLAVELNKIVPDVWVYDASAADYNTAGAKVTYAGVNDATDADGNPRDTNKAFARIVQFQLSDTLCANMGGILTLGYN